MNDCKDRNGTGSSIQNLMEQDDTQRQDDPCFPIFANEFFPCYYKFEQERHPYYYVRSNLLFGLTTKDLFKTWFDIQKFSAISLVRFRRELAHFEGDKQN